jgi:hypothetical protein
MRPASCLARTGLALIPALLPCCDRDAIYEQKSTASSIAEVWKDCDPAKIGFLTAKHGIQTAFENCGSNPFEHFSWSPDGIYIYFQMTHIGYVMNAEEKMIFELPTELPVHNATWLGNDLLVIPVGNSETRKYPRLALYNRADDSLNHVDLQELTLPADLQPSGKADQVLFTALPKGGERTVYRADFTAQKVEPAFSWWTGTLDTFAYTAGVDQVAWGLGETVTVAKGTTGEVLYTFEDATRGTVHANGRLIALETLGDPISTFKPKGKVDKSEAGQRRQKAREEQWKEEKPHWVPSEIVPPTLEFFDSRVNKRYRLSMIHGNNFQWYPGHPDYGSFVLWGLDKQQINKNVALTALGGRIVRLADKDEMPPGIELRNPPTP